MVAIVDYGMGNLTSVRKALSFLNIDSVITSDHAAFAAADAIILPGVGSFGQGMENLRERGLVDVLTHEVVDKKKKCLGICLGMQLLFENGTESILCKGLGWLPGTVKKMESSLRIPHMGWNNIKIIDNEYFSDIEQQDYYFIHSYHAVPDDPSIIAATVTYEHEWVASVRKDNIFATQFHPEKSQELGLSILTKFFKQC